jgi:hypothetical protein
MPRSTETAQVVALLPVRGTSTNRVEAWANPRARQAAGREDGRAEGGGPGPLGGWADDPAGAGVGLPERTAAQGKGERGGQDAQAGLRSRLRPDTGPAWALGAGRKIAENPPVLARSSSDRRCSLAAALIRTDRGSHTRSPSSCPSSTRRRAELEGRQERSVHPAPCLRPDPLVSHALLPAVPFTSLPNARVVLLRAPDVFGRANLPLRPTVLIVGVIAASSQHRRASGIGLCRPRAAADPN